MTNLNDILNFVAQKTGCTDVTSTCDIEHDLGCYGDDFDELIAEYSKNFKVDLKSYLWYFHTSEEGNNLGGIFFKPPNKKVKRIPVTPLLLLEFANKNKWDFNYPPHTSPKRRYDLLINLIFLCIAIAYGIYHWFIK